jgi:hypothetical protein
MRGRAAALDGRPPRRSPMSSGAQRGPIDLRRRPAIESRREPVQIYARWASQQIAGPTEMIEAGGRLERAHRDAAGRGTDLDHRTWSQTEAHHFTGWWRRRGGAAAGTFTGCYRIGQADGWRDKLVLPRCRALPLSPPKPANTRLGLLAQPNAQNENRKGDQSGCLNNGCCQSDLRQLLRCPRMQPVG